MVFHWCLSDNKFPQVSWTLLSILTDLSNAVVWIVFTHPLISKYFSPFVFLPILFSDYFRSADPRVVCIVSGDCDQPSSSLFYEVNAVFNAGESSSSLFS